MFNDGSPAGLKDFLTHGVIVDPVVVDLRHPNTPLEVVDRRIAAISRHTNFDLDGHRDLDSDGGADDRVVCPNVGDEQ